MVDIETAMHEGQAIANQLLAATSLYFENLKPSDIPEDTPGVYAIFDNNTKETLYVGRTKNLRRRLYTNHLHGPQANARLKKYLLEDELQKNIKNMADAKQYLKDNCYVKYIVESDTVRRGKIEGLLSYLLDVRYIHEEH
jgi:predicted GIY-YIG superfamily endonuclease